MVDETEVYESCGIWFCRPCGDRCAESVVFLEVYHYCARCKVTPLDVEEDPFDWAGLF